MIDKVRGLLPEAAVGYAFLASGWSAMSGFLLLLLVTWRLSPSEQGFYFSFSSLLLMQQFLELGFGVVLTQFVSHEWSHLWENEAEGSGASEARARLGSLVRMGIVWYAAVSVAHLLFVGGGGFLFFNQYGTADVQWLKPWIVVSSAAALGVMSVPLSSLLEGSGRVDKNQSILLCANLIGGLAAGAGLLLGTGLYSLGILVVLRVALGLPLLLWAARGFLRLWHEADPGVDWRREYWPQQWRISLSWFAGFLMFQAMGPITFAVQGPVVAGRLGATLQLYHAVNRLSSAWLVAAQPHLGRLGAEGRLRDLRLLAATTATRSVLSAAALCLAAIAGLALLAFLAPAYGARFAGLAATGLLLATAVAMQVSNVLTAAVRFQKREPFVLSALVGAALVACTTVVLGSAFGLIGVAFGFALVMLGIVLPWTIRLYRRELPRAFEAIAGSSGYRSGFAPVVAE